MTGSQPLAIAIVGMSCRLPGADGLESFWHMLQSGQQAIQELPDELVQRQLYYDARRGRIGSTYSTLGGLVPDCPQEQEQDQDQDLCHRMFCRVVEQACQHAGYSDQQLAGRRWGVYVGHSAGSSLASHLTLATMAEHVAELLCDLPAFQALSGPRQREILQRFVANLRHQRPRRDERGGPHLAAHWAATLVARHLQLDGPAVVIDAACASSLMALALGVVALRSGEVEGVIVGGASNNKLESLLLFSQAQSCSASGSRPFDQGADGLISSEGYVALVLKTLRQAQADGDNIHAVIQGLGMSSDGRGKSLWAPNPAGQKAALERAYGQALRPGHVQYVEAHATSTQVGDATEMESLNEFFGPHRTGSKIPIGSVKSNLGHTLESAGLVSLLKVVLAMQHGHIPATLHVEQPNLAVDWQHSPFEIATHSRPWPQPPEGSRCAAVSAFGIGGLNVHLVLHQEAQVQPAQEPTPQVPIAIIGRGLVLPGAHSLSQLRQLLQQGVSQRQSPPPERWRNPPPQAWAGYVAEVPFDCVRHKIAPRFYRSGNPLQFMLLSAADQALEEIGGSWQPQEAAVVVGTNFGGEFADQLALGLRFPEVRQALQQCLTESEAEVVDPFEERFFQAYPALFDETGGFTSSTLASRLSKAYNLMGGALALDCGESSSHVALKVACDLLRQQTVSAVLCAGGQRALNWVALESLQLEGWLDQPDYFPAEGAAVVVLKRLDMARRDGNPILGVLHGGGVAFGEVEAATRQAFTRAMQADCPAPRVVELAEGLPAESQARGARGVVTTIVTEPSRLSSLTGHLQAAQGVVSLIAASLQPGLEVRALHGLARGGQACALLVQGAPSPLSLGVPVRLGAANLQALRQQFDRLLGAATGFTPGDGARLFMLDPSPARWEMAAQRSWDAPGRALLQDQGIFIAPVQPRPRLAFLFAGQGSQHAGMMERLRANSAAARHTLERAERALAELGLPALTAMLESPSLMVDPVISQVAILVADAAYYAATVEDGLRPDCLCGHSFGEIPALVAADVLTLEEALQLTVVRARALLEASPDGGLLSVRLAAPAIQKTLDELGLPLHITHLNSPEQTVVGGRQGDLAQLQQRLEEERVACRRLRVPGALHTPLVQPARAALAAHLEGLDLRPPSMLFYSNVSNRPCHGVDEIRHNLLDQLVQPVRFMDMQERLYRDGVRVFVEVGPGQVLTQLMRPNLAERPVFLLACDHPQRNHRQQLQRAQAALECLGREALVRAPAPTGDRPQTGALLEYDATESRRRRRSHSTTPLDAPLSNDSPVHRFVMDYLVDLTGFAAQVIDVHWDLEADLGIDSIKRTQLFGELKAMFPMEASEQQLAELRTVQQIVAFVEAGHSGPPAAPAQDQDPRILLSAALAEGESCGRQHRDHIRRALRRAAAVATAGPPLSPAQWQARFTPEQWVRLQGLARGAGVHEGNLLAYQLRWGEIIPASPAQAVTTRYVLRLRPSPLAPFGQPPRWHGAALILGHNALARQLQVRLGQTGVTAHLLDPGQGLEAALERLEQVWRLQPAPHLFLLTPHDAEADSSWNWLERRRQAGLCLPFWFCQGWLARVKEAGLMDRASLVAITRMGGQLGLDSPIEAVESGALSGLLKAIGIESWVSGHRSIAVKVLDAAGSEPHDRVVDRLLQELAQPGYDREIGQVEGQRALLWAEPQALSQQPERSLSGHWLCTGGARGITAYVATQLATRYGLHLHLIGRAPLPDLPPAWLALWPDQRRQLRLQVMDVARERGINSVRYWEEVEKGLEIHHNLQSMRALGLQPHYYSCHLGDAQALQAVLREVRSHGPIEGILHGAGSSRDAHFEHKDPERVEECFRAKIDATLNLLNLTREDPLRYFVAFGSISGRFGANGHTDYSLANDMMAKLVGWYRRQRPDVAALTFHWHAWGDVGMAVKGETELGLKKIDMEFMPAREGLEHLVAELEAGAPEAEVLITSPRYHRQFFWIDEASASGRPLLGQADELWLDPEKEVFLRDHLMQGQPVLPLAVSLQLLWEAGRLECPDGCCLQEIEAASPLKFFDSRPRRLRLSTTPRERAREVHLTAEVVTRSGELVDPRRLIVRGVVQADVSPASLACCTRPAVAESAWQSVYYHPSGSAMVHGLSLRALRQVYREGNQLWGRITAPPLLELAGPQRSVAGWRIPSALLDACFYACGVLGWQAVEASQAVPQRLGWLWLGRLPRAGEYCEIQVRLQSQPDGPLTFDFEVWGNDGAPLVQARELELAWLGVRQEAGRA